MTLARINPGNWSVGDEVTSAQLNGIDTNATYALDKQAGNTDTLASVVSLVTAGRIVENVATGANADTTYVVGAANRVVNVTSAVTANRIYTLSATGAVTGDQLTIRCDSSFVTYEVTIKDQASVAMYTLGNLATSDGTWATFIYVGGWQLFRTTAKKRTKTYTSNDTLVVPVSVIEMTFEGVGAGGDDGGGRGGGGVSTGCGGAAGGGAKRFRTTSTVVPGETLTIVCGTAGTAGSAAADSNGGNGGHGGDSTVTGSTSGLLATFRGAQGGVGGVISTSTANIFGGLPCKPRSDAPNSGYRLNTVTDALVGSIPGQGGSVDADTAALFSYKNGGCTQFAEAGKTNSTGVNDGGGGGASEWNGGLGGNGGVGAGAGNGGAGSAGTLGSGGGGGGGGGATSGLSGGIGGVGGAGVVSITWVK